MCWSNEHDVYLCREVLLVEPYNHKPNTRERGSAWEFISENLNAIKEINLNVNRRSVRERLNLLVANFKKKVRVEEKASGIEVEESEIDQLFLEIVENI